MRGTGAAEAAAVAVFESRPGVWEVTEIASNQRAVRFWRRTIRRFTAGHFEESTNDDEVRQVFATST